MSRGRKPTPTATLQLRGTLRRDRRKNEPAYPDANLTPPPLIEQDADALSFWNHYGQLLAKSGVLKAADRVGLEAMALLYSRWMVHERLIRSAATTDPETGQVFPGDIIKSAAGFAQVHPAVAVARACQLELRKWAIEFGFTPSSRSRVDVPVPPIRDRLAEFEAKWGEKGTA